MDNETNDILSGIERENSQPEELKDDNGVFDEPQADEDLRADTAESIKLAIADAGQILGHEEVARAVAQGVFNWPGAQQKNIISLMKFLAEECGDEPVEVVDKTEEHQ